MLATWRWTPNGTNSSLTLRILRLLQHPLRSNPSHRPPLFREHFVYLSTVGERVAAAALLEMESDFRNQKSSDPGHSRRIGNLSAAWSRPGRDCFSLPLGPNARSRIAIEFTTDCDRRTTSISSQLRGIPYSNRADLSQETRGRSTLLRLSFDTNHSFSPATLLTGRFLLDRSTVASKL